MELELIQGIWGYHWWGNRKLFDEAAALGEAAAKKDLGGHWSFPTLKGMLAHIYGADRLWLARWNFGSRAGKGSRRPSSMGTPTSPASPTSARAGTRWRRNRVPS